MSDDTNIIRLSQFQRNRKTNIDIVPRNLNQETLLLHLSDPTKDIVFATGPAGSGKTLLATQTAIRAFRRGEVERIVITRPNVAVDDRDIGFLPGDILKKMVPWLRPILDIFEDYYTPKEITAMMEENIIEACPIAYIRGRTFKRAFVIVDEAQGTTAKSMLSILTRIGEGSKMVVTGDLEQSDRGSSNGLSDFLARYSHSDRIAVVRFTERDVERHPVVMEILDMYHHQKPTSAA